MKHIKHQIVRANTLLFLFVLLAIFLIFNVGVLFSSASLIKSEIANTTIRAQEFFELRLSRGDIRRNIEDGYAVVTKGFSRISRQTQTIDVLVLDSTGNILCPESFNDVDLTNDSVDFILTSCENSDKPQFLFGDFGALYAFREQFSLNEKESLELLLVGNVFKSVKRLTQILNPLLLTTLLLAYVVICIISNHLMKNILQPIIDVSNAASLNNNDDFHLVEDTSKCLEAHQLIVAYNDMIKRLQKYCATQTDVLHCAAHELRIPLQSIQGYAESIENNIFEDNKYAAGVIVSECNRLSHLIQQLLTLCRIDNSDTKWMFSEIFLPEFLLEVVKCVSEYPAKQGKTILLVPINGSLSIRSNDNLLMLAVLNVLHNALRYAKSRVEVYCIDSDDSVSILIHDDGPGISEKDAPFIFDRFYKGKNGSCGLGLSIVRSAVDALHGTVSFYNDNGAVFEIKIPRSNDETL